MQFQLIANMSVATVDATTASSNFNHKDNKYTCCCGNVHVLVSEKVRYCYYLGSVGSV